MNISHVSRMTGASPKAIRHYEAMGLIPNVQRKGNYRRYTQREVNLIRLIRTAQTLGFKLSELATLTEQGKSPTWLGVLGLVEQKYERVMDELARLDALREQLGSLRNELQDCLASEDEEIDLKEIECELVPPLSQLSD